MLNMYMEIIVMGGGGMSMSMIMSNGGMAAVNIAANCMISMSAGGEINTSIAMGGALV